MKPNYTIIASLALATVCLTAVTTTPVARAEMNANGAQVITNGPQTDPGDVRSTQTAPQNVRDSGRYDALVRSNPNYRAVRERKECGSIDNPRMHADCVASFGK